MARLYWGFCMFGAATFEKMLRLKNATIPNIHAGCCGVAAKTGGKPCEEIKGGKLHELPGLRGLHKGRKGKHQFPISKLPELNLPWSMPGDDFKRFQMISNGFKWFFLE